MKIRAALLAAALFCVAHAISVGYVVIESDSTPDRVYLDATAVEVGASRCVVEAMPGKHFVSIFPPRKVYLAMENQAPEQFWEKLRALGAIGSEYDLLSSYEAGSVRVGTSWIYVTPEDTVTVKLSHAEAAKTYRKDSGCVTSTFFGWTLLVGAAMMLSIIVGAINT
jgi:hypothetical protein